VLQCVAVCCSLLQCVAVCCSVSQCVAVRCSVVQCVAVCCCVLQCVAACCSVLQCNAVCCSLSRMWTLTTCLLERAVHELVSDIHVYLDIHRSRVYLIYIPVYLQ